MAVLAPLRELDEVAYLRFASVYRAFDDLEAFEAEIALLRAEHELLRRRTRHERPVEAAAGPSPRAIGAESLSAPDVLNQEAVSTEEQG